MVSLLEEGLRSDDSDEYQTPSEEVTLTSIRLRLRRVTKKHHDVFIFNFFFPAPFDPSTMSITLSNASLLVAPKILRGNR